MTGTDAVTGKHISGIDHLRQSIRDILTTPLGSRVMRRDYGSKLFDLTDSPMNQATKLDMFAATAEALAKWEPRFKLSKTTIGAVENGNVSITVEGEYRPSGQQITLEGIKL